VVFARRVRLSRDGDCSLLMISSIKRAGEPGGVGPSPKALITSGRGAMKDVEGRGGRSCVQ
jgi:hypothetical protein